jgi:hypothetical protein
MAIELSNVTFTEQDDVVPQFGVEEILNTGIANTLAGNDIIIGTKETTTDTPYQQIFSSIFNSGTLNTADGDDIITGIISTTEDSSAYYNHDAIHNIGSISTGNGDDIITGSGVYGLVNYSTITTDNGNDIISGTGEAGAAGLYTRGTINSGDGNDIIIGANASGSGYGIFNGFGTSPDEIASSTIDTGDGNDIVTAVAAYGILNLGIINTGDGADSIICDASSNNDIGYGFYNANIINTGDGNDLITEISGHSIHNLGIINTGNGADSIIAEGGFYEESYSTPGSVFLENGTDYLKAFGRGNFNGGNGKDTLELTSGNYTIGISGTTVNFTKGSAIMETSNFEILIAGNTTYAIPNLINGQTIIVA